MRLERIAALTLAVTGTATTLPAQAPLPSSGQQVLERMRVAYDGKWYSTLTFVQKTTLHRPTGKAEQTWYEALRYTPERGTQLRIDIGDPSLGNGSLFTADSSWVIRGGAVTAVRDRGNEFLPLIESVYMQPVERTIRDLRQTSVDLSRVRAAEWRGRAAWVVGAAEPTDSTSPQFWVDVERLVVVRMILRATPQAPLLDVDLDGYERLAGGWIATKILIRVDGALVQEEEYADWKANVPLSAALFEPSNWTTAPHWRVSRGGAEGGRPEGGPTAEMSSRHREER